MMLGLAAIPSFVQLVGMLFMPESPRWLGIRNTAKQEQVMSKIYKPEHLEVANRRLTAEV